MTERWLVEIRHPEDWRIVDYKVNAADSIEAMHTARVRFTDEWSSFNWHEFDVCARQIYRRKS
jgi:hypothetical protein